MSFIIFPGVITPPLTPGAVPYGTGSNVLMNAQGTAGQVLLSTGAGAPVWGSTVPSTAELAGGVAGDLPYQQAPNDTTFLNLVTGAVLYGGAAAPAYTALGTTGQPLLSNGTAAPAFGTLPVSGGGTGLATLTAENVILGDGTNNVKFVAPGASGNVLQSNGTTWTSATPSGGANLQTFTSSGTWTKPANATFVMVECWGAGGGGKGGRRASAGGGPGTGGGGGGAYVFRLFDATSLGATETVTIGAGGSGGTGGNPTGGNGGNGGDTTFGTHLTAYGGSGAIDPDGAPGAGVLSSGAIGYPEDGSVDAATGIAAQRGFGGARIGSSVNNSYQGQPSGFGGASGGSSRAGSLIAPYAGGSSYQGGAGGGAGGGNDSNAAFRQGGAGGGKAGRNGGGGAGGASATPGTAGGALGLGGGGGGGNNAGAGAAGGAGGIASGGGGGGDGTSGTAGAGGAGGAGYVRVYTW